MAADHSEWCPTCKTMVQAMQQHFEIYICPACSDHTRDILNTVGGDSDDGPGFAPNYHSCKSFAKGLEPRFVKPKRVPDKRQPCLPALPPKGKRS
jgi:hypothetical protein